MAGRVTLEDIALHVGVSTAAVSQALSGKGALSQATRERILQVVEELAYRPDQVAQSLARRYATEAGGRRLKRTRKKHLPPPGIMVFYSITELMEVIHLEMQQREQEGCEVSLLREMLTGWSRPTKQKIYDLYSQLVSAPQRPDFAYQEPETMAEIQRERPAGPARCPYRHDLQRPVRPYSRCLVGACSGVCAGKTAAVGLAQEQGGPVFAPG
jgi:AcrR family transcriptional regulator